MVQALECWIGKAATYLGEMNIDILSYNVAAAAAELVSLSAQLTLLPPKQS